MPRPYRIYYPGFISLVGMIALLLYVYFNWQGDNYIGRRSIVLPTDKNDPTWSGYSNAAILARVQRSQVVEIELDPVDEVRLKGDRIAFVRREIERIAFTRSSQTVLKVVLSYNTHISDLLGLLYNVDYYWLQDYALVDDCFYIFGNEPPHEDR